MSKSGRNALLTPRRGAGSAALLLAFSAAMPVLAQPAPTAAIYSCVDASGKKVTSDRPIPACNSRDQHILNRDGSVRGVLSPTPTADERSERETREREAAADRVTRLDAIRSDRNLLARYPKEAVHRKARESALEDVRQAQRRAEDRLATLARERKPLTDESEFYVGRQLPYALQNRLDANDASVEAMNTLLRNQQLEEARIQQRYDVELERLTRLWNGEQPGSLGGLASAGAPAPEKQR